MNNYMDYYNYINNLNQIPNNLQVMNNNATGNNKNIDIINKNQNNQNSKSIAEPYEGFIKGNMFNNLYYGYKNYKPQELNPQNDKEYLQLLVQMYAFAAHDLGLYLDVNPKDANIIRQRNEYIKMYNEALVGYENNYGTITNNNLISNTNSWAWEDTKWPWEGIK